MATVRYRLHERLGGAASRVHRAHDVLLQRDVVVKSFPGDDGRERWERDALLRERLGPGRAMEVLDGAPDGDDGPFVVMPLARDGSLAAATTPSDPAAAALLVARLAAGLGCLHRRGVVHGRVGADAVLLDPTLGPRWTGDGAPAPVGASPEDDVLALARIAVLAATGPLALPPAPSGDVVDAVRALVHDAADVDARERLRAGLAGLAPALGPRSAGHLGERATSGRSRRAVLVACVGAVIVGGALGVGAGATGGDASAAVAGTIGDPAVVRPAPALPAHTLIFPEPVDEGGASSPPARTGSRAGAGGASSAGMRATSSGLRDRSGDRAEERARDRAGDGPGGRAEQHTDDRAEDRAEDRSGGDDRDADRGGATQGSDDTDDIDDTDDTADDPDRSEGSGRSDGDAGGPVGDLLDAAF
ncbi:hypothetical protein PHK61_17350 [Actinomycetospora lutea]|uniref:hypothetical protein n=1 Tax=Actinomycetospora lutea TaxID=663604 RepID=UPI002365A89C|nr:hypothetical protein [Actinomycetospora lutea]MDD7940192.1 hypothetical protein [Actinomycetospora lutea]